MGIRVGPEYFMCVEANKVVIVALGIVAVVASAVAYTQFYMSVSQGPALVLMSMFACKVRGGCGERAFGTKRVWRNRCVRQ
jgi:hypothetical protein